MSEKLQLAEVFDSLQGEGTWVGTPMLFVRLAGCNVGRPAATVLRKSTGFELQLPILSTGAEAKACATYDGRTFWCDTDYSNRLQLTVEEVFSQCWQKHICLTGGEPFLHEKRFEEINEQAVKHGIQIHVETSGTIMATKWYGWWITCAPKIMALGDMITASDEVKLLVDARFHPDDVPPSVFTHKNVFLCPVNDMLKVKQDNVERCIIWLRKYPHWRMSWQAHKDWGMR